MTCSKPRARKQNAEASGRDDRRPQAYHEAGHAAMYFFFGEAGDFCSVDITALPRRGTLGRTRAKSTTRVFATLVPGKDNGDFQRFAVIRCIMLDLAGYSAQYKATMPDDLEFDWLEAEWLNQLSDDDPRSDYCSALEIAQRLQGQGRQKRIALPQIARWTDEAIRRPRMWNVVEAVADALLHRGQLGREAAWRIMEKAWGPEGHLPFLGTKTWQRRFRIAKFARPASAATGHKSDI